MTTITQADIDAVNAFHSASLTALFDDGGGLNKAHTLLLEAFAAHREAAEARAREECARAAWVEHTTDAERASLFISPSDGDHAALTALFRAHRNSAEREIAELKGALMKAGPIHAGPIGGELGRKYPDARQCVIEFAPEQAAGAYDLHGALVRLRAALDPAQIAQEVSQMPDIAMCDSVCPKSRECRRHRDSGTKPRNWFQSWTTGIPGDDCPVYWPVEDAAP